MNCTATVTREGPAWLAEVEGLPGAHAYARTLKALRRELSDAVILSAELDDYAIVDIAFRAQRSNLNPFWRAVLLTDGLVRR